MKIAIEERDETQEYRPAPIEQILQMVKVYEDRTVIFVPNLCGGETRITIFNSTIPNGNEANIIRCKEITK
jgi:hypothetical protein